LNQYPLALLLVGRKVLVVGGGHLAQRCTSALVEAGAAVTVVSPSLTPALEVLPIAWLRRRFRSSDVDDTWLVHAATGRPEVDTLVAAAAEERRVFCVQADDRYPATAVRVGSGSARPTAHDFGRRGGVALIGAGPGDPELITVKGRRLLAEADVVVADRLASGLLLDGLRQDVELIDAAKVPYGRQLSQQKINELLVDRALAGKFVARLKGGDPYIFGRGGEELAACVEAGIAVEVVPGVTSAISVPALVGIPITHRGMTHEFTVVSGHLPPSHPDSLVDWGALGRLRGTLVLLMAVRNLAAITARLIIAGRDPATPAAIIQDGSTSRERIYRGTLADISTLGAVPPAVIVIGDVAKILPVPLPSLPSPSPTIQKQSAADQG
jgi:uroporphyrin-III C-methyltransferase/precorrin-2 dehydrogenase/sirohydrochlorin ferrochelatase